MRIIFVCTGNTCRSPMAEKIFANMVDGKDVIVESRGVATDEGAPMSLNSRIVMREMGLSTSHSSTMLTADDIAHADMIITMTQSHKAYVEAMFGKSDKVHALGEYTGKCDIVDPYGGDIDVYRDCARDIKEGLTILKSKLNI